MITPATVAQAGREGTVKSVSISLMILTRNTNNTKQRARKHHHLFLLWFILNVLLRVCFLDYSYLSLRNSHFIENRQRVNKYIYFQK